ncbi:caffeoylshikimate esterase-like isoform X2 [Malania oleifera]|uniref:caffeoylshikimate esterase-like isoform X2 n=1 Tax=Malania oleifera TaxID=397392 RepID=UPI0025AE3D9A|nr:caffeoylshikimate esterase-like isoform X2 [Malania oleifera]
MGGLGVPAVTSRSSITLLMTAIIFSNQFVEEYRDMKKFLYGESMGGAVALLLHKKDPTFWDGAVLVAPMCKISEKVKPHPVVVNILTRVEEIIPKWKIVPTKDVINSAFKDPVKREEVRSNKLIYQDKPRLKTALEMLRVSMSLEDSLNEVKLPFFVLHGEADIVTDPEVSKALYEHASSKDKTIKLYPGMWHALTSGEPDGNVETVFADIGAWLDKRTGADTALVAIPQGYHLHDLTTVKLTPTIPLQPTEERPKQLRTKPQGSYLCGWKRRYTHHHSAL